MEQGYNSAEEDYESDGSVGEVESKYTPTMINGRPLDCKNPKDCQKLQRMADELQSIKRSEFWKKWGKKWSSPEHNKE